MKRLTLKMAKTERKTFKFFSYDIDFIDSLFIVYFSDISTVILVFSILPYQRNSTLSGTHTVTLHVASCSMLISNGVLTLHTASHDATHPVLL